jgi:hypothetical protein
MSPTLELERLKHNALADNANHHHKLSSTKITKETVNKDQTFISSRY